MQLTDINCQAIELIDPVSQLRVLKIIPQDPNYTEATFDIAFLTPAEDNSGVQHITEHSVLCGSEHFRVKEPFQVLLQQSLQTYLNAGTYAEHTVYPFSTRSEQDFYNIMEVYLDAVFSPLLHEDPLIFQQEGHHVEVQEDTLIRKGVVLNEMKGAYSDPERVGETIAQKLLFPEGSMRFDSGGNPDEIPQLTLEQFRKFHKSHYHSKNAFLVIVSKFPLEKELKIVKQFIKTVEAPLVEVKLQKTQVNCTKEEKYAASEGQGEIFINQFLLYNNADVPLKTYIMLSLVDDLIHDNPASPFKHHVGGEFKSSFDGSQAQAMLTLTCTGSKLSFEEYQTILIATYQQIVDGDYITQESALAALSKFEFRQREIKDHHGIKIANEIFRSWLYGGPFEKFVQQGETIKQLKQDNNLVQMLKDVVATYFLRGSVQLKLVPEAGLAEKRIEEDKKQLKEKFDSLSEEEKKFILENQEKVASRQKQEESAEAKAAFKQLQPKDLQHIGDQIASLSGTQSQNDGFSFFEFESGQNQISYTRAYFDFSADADKQMLSYVSLLKTLFAKVRTDKFATVQDLNQEIDKILGSFSVGVKITDTENGAQTLIHFNIKYLTDNANAAHQLLFEIIANSISNLTEADLAKLVDEMKNKLQNKLQGRGAYSLAVNRAMGKHSASYAAMEYMEGLKMLKFLESEIKLSKLKKIVQKMLYEYPILFCFSTGKQNSQTIQKSIHTAFQHVKTISAKSRKFDRTPEIHSQISAEVQKSAGASFNVNYVCKAFDHRSKPQPANLLADTILDKSYLWDNVRVLNGAYGCFLVTSLKMQQYVVSYRDPSLEATIAIFDRMPDFIRNLKLSPDELFRFKIGALGQRQKSLAPEERFALAVGYFLDNSSAKEHAALVNGIVGVTVEDLQKTAEIYQKTVDQGAVVFGKAGDVQKWTGGDMDRL